jgi:alcohol dehydrogenase
VGGSVSGRIEQDTAMTWLTLASVPEIAAGPERVTGLGEDITRLAGAGARVLLVCDPALVALGVAERVAGVITSAGHAASRFDDISSDARETQVTNGRDMAAAMNADLVIGLGGGSALDAAKMIAGLGSGGPAITDYRLAARELPERGPRLVCIPTTAGTGSEVTSTSVLSAGDGTKYWYWSRTLNPDLVILDAVLSVSLPAPLTAATGLDALVHAMEAATGRRATQASELYALGAIPLVVGNLPRAVRDPGDLEARQQMLLAACFAGIAIENAGTALAHNIAHALGSLVPVHHGRAAAIAMAATIDWVVEGNAEAFSRVAAVFGEGCAADRLPARFRAFIDEVGLDPVLPAVPDPAALSARMAAPENAPMRLATARQVDDAALAMLAARVSALAAGRMAVA